LLDTLREIILTRRSVRRFSSLGIEAEKRERLVESLRWAPSAGNIQPWKFFFASDPSVRTSLAEAAWNQHFIGEAPLVVAVCAVPGESAARYGKRGSDLYCLMDCAAAIENLLLTCTALGMGACWVGAFDDDEVAQVLNLSPALRPVALVAVGYPAEVPKAPSRKAASKIIEYL
jgi:nitroreductase